MINEGFNFLVKSKDDIVERKVEIKDGMSGIRMAVKDSFLKNKFKNEILLNIPFSYEIAFFDTLGKFRNSIEFDLKDSGIDLEKRIKLMKGKIDYSIVKDEKLTEMVASFFPFENQYFAFFERGGNEYHYVFMNDDFKVNSQSNRIKNDIDGMKIRNIPWTSTGEHLVFKINSNDFLNDYRSKFDKTENEFSNGSIHEFISKNLHLLDQDKTVLVLLKIKTAT
jgi:hypothetical protein